MDEFTFEERLAIRALASEKCAELAGEELDPSKKFSSQFPHENFIDIINKINSYHVAQSNPHE